MNEHRRLEVEGEDAIAQIISVTQTGLSLNDQPELELELRVFPEKGLSYDAKTTLICPLVMLYEYQPGNSVAVKIDRVKNTVTIKGSSAQVPVY